MEQLSAADNAPQTTPGGIPVTEQARLLDLSTDAIIVCDVDNRIIFWNRGATTLYGWPPDEAIGHEVHALLGTESDIPVAELMAMLHQFARLEREVVQVTRAGRRITTFGRWALDRDTEGRARAILATYTDITERKRAQAALHASEEKYRSLFNSMDEGYLLAKVIFDEDAQPVDLLYLDANPAATRMIGQDYTGKRLREIDPTYESYWFDIFGRVARTGEGERLERYAAPLRSWFDFYVFKIDPEADWVAVVFQDITARKRREANLALLADIATDFSRLSSADEIMRGVGAKLNTYLDISHCLFAEIDEAQDTVMVESVWRTPDAPDLMGVYRLSEFVTEEFQHAARAGEPVVIHNTQTDPRTDARSYAAFNIHSFISVPSHRDGAWKYLLTINHSAARDWRDDEVELILDVTNRIFPRLERARAEVALRESEARQAFLVQLGDTLRTLVDPLEIQATAARVLGEYLEADRVMYGEVTGPDDEAFIIHWDYRRGGMPSATGRHRFDDFGAYVAGALRAGQTLTVEDVSAMPEHTAADRASYEARAIRAYVAVPLVKAGRIVAYLATNQRTPRAWTPQEVALVEEVAERTWAAVERARAEAALRDSEARYRTLFESMDEGFCILEIIFDAQQQPIDYRYSEINPAFAQQTGMQDALGRTIRELVPDIEPFWIAVYGQVALTGEPTRFVSHAEPLGRWFDVYAFCLGDPDHPKVAVLFNDITERKRAEQALRDSEARLRAIANLVPDLLWSTDPHGCTAWYNQRWLEYTGQTLESTHSAGWLDVIHPDDREQWQRTFETAIASGQPLRQEHRIRGADGVYRWFLAQAHPLTDDAGRIVRWYGAATNIHNERLALAETQAALQTRDQFLSIASHELRTPLTSLMGYVQLLQKRAAQGTADPVKLAALIMRHAQRLNTLIGQLLDISRLERGQFAIECQSVDLTALVAKVVDEVRAMQPPDTNHPIDLCSPEQPVLVVGDAQRLEQVLQNLLSNAVKYSPQGGAVQVWVRHTATDAIVEVHDRGIGIPAEAQAQLFEPFYRASNVGPEVSGFGLGLHIVREIVQRHGGRIEVESTEGQGSTFRVVVPLDTAIPG